MPNLYQKSDGSKSYLMVRNLINHTKLIDGKSSQLFGEMRIEGKRVNVMPTDGVSRLRDLNPGPRLYESRALPLS